MKISLIDRPVSLPARIAETLLREITERRLKPGDRLPTEQYLAANFGVSRNVVREAIAHLRSAGVLHSRQGLGTVVAQNDPDRSFRLDMDASGDGAAFLHVYELRMGIEMEAAALAARRATKAQLKCIDETLKRLQEARRWEMDGVSLDIDFHLAVAEASGNPLMVEAINVLTERMRQTITATRERSGAAIGEVKRLTVDEHAAIRDTIMARKPIAARQAVARHLTSAAHRLGFDMTSDAGLVQSASVKPRLPMRKRRS
jgi:GntR family transcriptional repressor for pyruvate dehydrogenase complex